MNKKIYAAVSKRAAGSCEGCFGALGESGHLDHFFGRKHAPETVDNCWMLCLSCDDNKTNNRPSAIFWLEQFVAHCALRGYAVAAERAGAKLAVQQLKFPKA